MREAWEGGGGREIQAIMIDNDECGWQECVMFSRVDDCQNCSFAVTVCSCPLSLHNANETLIHFI